MRRAHRFDADEPAIARRSLPDLVADHIRALIIHGDLAPGEKAPIGALAAEFGVSSTPIREALKILADERLVELTPSRGARVAPFSELETAELFEVMASLEGLAAELAAVRMSAAELNALQSLHSRMRGHFDRGEKDPYFELNSAIHQGVLRAAGNGVLVEAHGKLNLRAARGRYIAIIDQSRWDEAMAEHESLMDALRNREPERAGAIWRLHLKRTGAAVRRALTAQLARGEAGSAR